MTSATMSYKTPMRDVARMITYYTITCDDNTHETTSDIFKKDRVCINGEVANLLAYDLSILSGKKYSVTKTTKLMGSRHHCLICFEQFENVRDDENSGIDLCLCSCNTRAPQ